ncbi:MAG TPA: class I SAM-dependent methyltransferase [Planctomycetota bacterium]|nr:class I SAM-dependent methyltransferase [Planctomycetota bacterium]
MMEFRWTEDGETKAARWRSENGAPPPARGVTAGDAMTADAAYRLAREGSGLLWRGDFQNARKLMQAMDRRVGRRSPGKASGGLAEVFQQQRREQEFRAHTLGMILLPFDADHRVPLRRAPDVRQACLEAYGEAQEPYVASLRELHGLIGAHEWRKTGIKVPVLGARIHPHYGVFTPVRHEYADLVAAAAIPSRELAFDIGTGTGVLAALLARRGVKRVVATDLDARAVACARENLDRLGYGPQVEVRETDLFPEGRAPLIVCNPPWIPAQPTSTMERAVYDPDSRMLKAFLAGLAAHLEPQGEGWLILSDLAERLGLRSRAELESAISAGGLKIAGRQDSRSRHPRTQDKEDPLHVARAAEVTSLWRLTVDPLRPASSPS